MSTGNGDIEYVTVFSSNSTLDVGMAKGYLESHGIQTVIRDEHMGSAYNWASGVIGGVKLQVASKDAGAAQEILSQVDLTQMSEPTTPKRISRLVFGAILLGTALVLIYGLGQIIASFLR